MPTIVFLVVFALIGSVLPVSAMAQNSAPNLPAIAEVNVVNEVETSEVAEAPVENKIPEIADITQSNFAEHFLKAQTDIWSSPLKVKRSDMKWLVPIGVGAAAFLATDTKITDAARRSESLRPASKVFSKLHGTNLLLTTGAIYGIGKLTGNEKVAETGKLAAEAVLHSELLVRGVKTIFNRERPNKVDGQSQFWGGGRSFPSGHAAGSFAFATVIAGRYKGNKWVQVGAYGLATAVSLSRIGGVHHHPSDVLIGATIGHLIGRYILRRHPAEN
jgi:hypothetical protein